MTFLRKNHEQGSFHLFPPLSRVASLFDTRSQTLAQGGQALAEAKLGAWKLYTLGIIINGIDPQARISLLEAKGTEREKILSGERTLVSVLPPREYREGLIDISQHHNPIIEEALTGDERLLLTEEGHPLFYRVFAGDAPYLEPPLTQIDRATGLPTIVLLWHDNKRIHELEAEMRKHTDGQALLTGSSANMTGEKQKVLLRNLDDRVRRHVVFSVDVQDQHSHAVPLKKRDSIPMIDLTTIPPTVRREGMYPAMPKHPGLRALLLGNPPHPQPEEPRRAA